MKKVLFYALGFLGSFSAFSQMYVSPSSYVFVNNEFMYVKQDVNIQPAGNFYLRNNSQLLQGGTGAGTNKGTGDLSVFQEGTVNNFQYNYWCSPVGEALASAGNNPFGITRLFRPTGVTTSTAATITSGFDGVANPLTISTRWIYKFITSSVYAQWVAVGANTSINPGEGFTMKGTSGNDNLIAQTAEGVQNNTGSKQRYDFRGKPNDGNISVVVSAGNFTLVGNPYPSAIDLDRYLLDDTNKTLINGQAYFWEQVVVNSHILNQYQGGYGIYNPKTGIYTPAAFVSYDGAGNPGAGVGTGSNIFRKFSPVGQGFMVFGIAPGNVTMRNDFRLFIKEGVSNLDSYFARTTGNTETSIFNADSEFFPEIPNVAGIDYTTIKKGPAPHIRIHAMYNNGGVRPTTIAFLDSATDGFDYGADGRSPSAEATEFYYILSDMPYEYVATAVKFDINKRIPVGLRCLNQAVFKIQVKDIVNFDADQEVYIFDKQTGIYHDIKNNTFEMTLPPGDNRTRFEITFKNGTLSNDDFEAINDSFTVIQNNNQGMLTLLNTNNKEVVSVVLYDITGKQVLNKTNLGTAASYEFSTVALSDGVYVVKATTKDNVVVSKKVSVYKK